MRRATVIAATALLGAALATRATEAAGVRHCDCSPTCWCRKPTLNLFRWVTPLSHR